MILQLRIHPAYFTIPAILYVSCRLQRCPISFAQARLVAAPLTHAQNYRMSASVKPIPDSCICCLCIFSSRIAPVIFLNNLFPSLHTLSRPGIHVLNLPDDQHRSWFLHMNTIRILTLSNVHNLLMPSFPKENVQGLQLCFPEHPAKSASNHLYDILVACIFHPAAYHCISGLPYHFLTYITAEFVPAIPSHRWRLCQIKFLCLHSKTCYY